MPGSLWPVKPMNRTLPASRASKANSSAPPAPQITPVELGLFTDDPDTYQAHYRLPLVAQDALALDVGDVLDEDYAFLDPEGLAGLEGQVTVLAYFALF